MKKIAFFIIFVCVFTMTYAQNPRIVKDVFPGPFHGVNTVSSAYADRVIGRLGNIVYFVGRDNSNTGYELWKTDGTDIGTVLVKDINLGLANSEINGPGIELNGELFFTADDGIHGKELWKTDGTAVGTVMIYDLDPIGGSSFSGSKRIKSGNNLFFLAHVSSANYLCKTNGTVGNADTLYKMSWWDREIIPYGVDKILTSSEGKIIMSDGTYNGTNVVYDVNNITTPPSCSSFYDILGLQLIGNDLFFARNSSQCGGVWKYNISTGIPSLISLLSSGVAFYDNLLGTTSNGVIYNLQDPGSNYYKWLFVNNSTSNGPYIFNPNAGATAPFSAFSMGNYCYFTGDDGIHGDELWKTDGTLQGTELVKDFTLGAGSTSFGGRGRYVKNDLSNVYYYDTDQALVKTDGTTTGTSALFSYIDGWPFEYTEVEIVVDGKLYFTTGGDTLNGNELWVYDPSIPITINTQKIDNVDFIHAEVYPNPAEMFTNVYVTLRDPQDIRMEIYSSLGQLLEVQIKDNTADHNFKLDLSQYAAGIYYAKILTDNAFKMISLSKM